MPEYTIIQMRESQASHYKQLSCRDGGRQDHNLGIKDKMTGWGVVSADRCKRGVSRSAHIKTGKGKRGGKN